MVTDNKKLRFLYLSMYVPTLAHNKQIHSERKQESQKSHFAEECSVKLAQNNQVYTCVGGVEM